ncbi:MAG: hypothetical protein H7Y04_11750, partial [Verrucomicrobia bacterium]|nr:hypothetical protein [Cytophagales bacterium]
MYFGKICGQGCLPAVGRQHQRGQTRNLNALNSCTDKLGLSLVLLPFLLLLFFLCIQKKSKKASLFQKVMINEPSVEDAVSI